MTAPIDAIVDQLTLEEQVSLLSGVDAWCTPAIPRLGIGPLKVSDGPNGARGENFIAGTPSAVFPVGIALGASWNTALVHEIGVALAHEARLKGARMLLAPTVNLQRSVTNGRNFECYSEDPILTAELATAYITGLQSEGVAATIKHFAGNESEIERTTIDSLVDERSLRELYLVPFEWAVKKAGTWGIMSSYNRLNGDYTSENHWLLTKVLRDEWNYTGIVMSDWWGSHSTAPTINAGLDLEMPGPPRDRGDKLVAAVKSGEVDAARVRTSALNMLRLLERTGALTASGIEPERVEDRPETRALIRRAGCEAIVLLKNDGVLPLAGTGKVAVIGPNAKTAQAMGGGSSQLNPHYVVSPWDGLAAALGEDRLIYAEGTSNARFEPAFTGVLEAEFYDSPDLTGPAVGRTTVPAGGVFLTFHGVVDGVADANVWSARFRGSFVPHSNSVHRFGVVSIGLAKLYVDGKLVVDSWTGWKRGRAFFEEGGEEVVGEMTLEAGRRYEILIEFSRKPAHVLDIPGIRFGIGREMGDADIAAAAEAAARAETAVVFVGRTGEWDTEGSDLMHISLPGRQDELVAAVAAANPRTIVVLQTGGPIEMPWLSKVAGVVEAWYLGQEVGNSIADVLTGVAEPGGRLPQTFPVRWSDNPTQSQDPEVYPGLDGKVRYEEGLFIGYRHYDRTGIAPLFPFGFGLSYTSFVLSDLSVGDDRFESDGEVSVSVTVTNTGARRGSDVVQIYVGDPESGEPRPRRELKGFAKVVLDPGASERVNITLDARAFAYYSLAKSGWVVEPGTFTITAGRNAGDAGLASVVVRQTPMTMPA